MIPDFMELTDGWLTDWGESGGALKEWVRSLHLSAVNHGWIKTLASEPVYLCQNALHVISWIPVLWRDRDWDNTYLWIMLREKLRRMRLHHETERITTDWSEVSEQIRAVEIRLDRLIEDEYDGEHAEGAALAERLKKYNEAEARRKRDSDEACELLKNWRSWWS